LKKMLRECFNAPGWNCLSFIGPSRTGKEDSDTGKIDIITKPGRFVKPVDRGIRAPALRRTASMQFTLSAGKIQVRRSNIRAECPRNRCSKERNTGYYVFDKARKRRYYYMQGRESA
jgi:hypothetical protein